MGLEYQLLDDEVHPDGKLGINGNRKTASLYDVFPASEKKKMNPVGEWNTARVVAKGTKVTHFLNGKKVLTFDRKSSEYEKALGTSKFVNSVPRLSIVRVYLVQIVAMRFPLECVSNHMTLFWLG